MGELFRALVVREAPHGGVVRAVESRRIDELPAGDVLVRVQYSALNYKDALSASGHRGITRRFPHTPGIEAVGKVVESQAAAFPVGTDVIVTGYDLGMNTAGGFGQFIRVPSDWVVPRPATLSAREAMILGTAGFTAALAVFRLQQLGLDPAAGEALVTGATGGVGGFALAILAREGYAVTAATGKVAEREYLRALGAADVIPREELKAHADRPLIAGRWSSVIDTVGGGMLAAILRAVKPHGAVVTCGMVDGATLETTVYPFILRGIALLGVDSAATPMAQRRRVWDKLGGDWKPARLDTFARECTLDTLEEHIAAMLNGQIRGRVLVDLDA